MRYKYPSMIIIAFIGLSVSGCVTNTRHEIIVKNEKVHIPIPSSLLEPIKPLPPPDKDLYINSDCIDKTQLLTNYVIELLKTSKMLNDRLTSIHKFDLEQIRITNEYNRREVERVNDVIKNTVQEIKQYE